MTIDLMLARWRGQIKVKDEHEDVFEKIKGTEIVIFVHNTEEVKYLTT